MTTILAIETSCDETGVGIARLDPDGTVVRTVDTLNALAAFQTISISVSRSFRKRSIPLSSSSNNLGYEPFKKSI